MNNNDATEISVKSNKKKNIIITLILVLAFVLTMIFLNVSKPLGEYIDGNVLKLPATVTTMSETQPIGNPWKNASISGQFVFRALFSTDSTLTQVNPDLCSNYETLNDGLTYVLNLKDNLFWSDGTPLTLDDVVFSIEAFMKCADVNPSISAAFNKIEGVSDYVAETSDSISGLTVNGNQLTINLEHQYNNFMLMLTQFVPLPKHILFEEDWSMLTNGVHEFFINENPVGNGMYTSNGLDDDYNLVLTKNPYYEGNPPNIDTVIFYWDFQNMDLDFFHTTDVTQIVNYRALKKFQEYLVDVYFYRYFLFNLTGGVEYDNEIIQDVRVRQAIAHAIDQQVLLNDVYYNAGKILYSGHVYDNNQEYEYNPEKARELLEEANYDFDRPLVITYYYSDATSYLFLERVAQYLNAVGLKVDLIKSNGSEDLYELCQYDIMLKGLSSFNTEDWYNEYLSTSLVMHNFFKTTQFDDLVNKFNSVSSDSEYESTLKELVSLEQDLLYKLPLFTLHQAVYINTSRLQVPADIVFGNTRYMSNLRIGEWQIKRQ